MISSKVFKRLTTVLPQFLKKAVRRVIDDSTSTIANTASFHGNETSIQFKKNIPTDDKWESLKKVEEDVYIDENLKKNPLAYTHRMCFELSNLCDYAKIHKKCPLYLSKEPEILQAKVIFDSLDFLAKYSFSGMISFHNYNEPLLDPRLFMFIKYARNSCPDSDIHLCTNGSHITQILANELVATGVSSIHITVYSTEEMDRLSKIHLNIPYKLGIGRLDDRLKIYCDLLETNSKKPCFAPLNEIIITSNAHVTLCCLDWRRRYSFGNLERQTLEEIIMSKTTQIVYQRLSKGDRLLNICKRCDWAR